MAVFCSTLIPRTFTIHTAKRQGSCFYEIGALVNAVPGSICHKHIQSMIVSREYIVTHLSNTVLKLKQHWIHFDEQDVKRRPKYLKYWLEGICLTLGFTALATSTLSAVVSIFNLKMNSIRACLLAYRNVNMYLYFVSFLLTERTQIDEMTHLFDNANSWWWTDDANFQDISSHDINLVCME